jgi:hypothetical protein
MEIKGKVQHIHAMKAYGGKQKSYRSTNSALIRGYEVKNTTLYVFSFDVSLIVNLSIFMSVINELDTQNFCFIKRLFHASTCFEHMCSSS